MRHHSKTKTLGRKKKAREALVDSLARSLVLKGAITTSLAKAKTLRPHVEKLITTAKNDTVANRRKTAQATGNDRAVLDKLYKDVAVRYKDRQGGYTRIVKLGKIGAASMESARIELV